ncbi:hypothetical protein E2320_012817, partial [Naja naja]
MCSLRDPATQPDQEAFLLLFEGIKLSTLQAALNQMSMEISRDQMLPTFKRFLLNAAWEKIKTDPLVSNAGFLSSWFQETMHSYLTDALDSVYPDMDNSTRQSCQKRSPKEWIQSNWKSFQNHASYNDFTNIWSGFDGFATLDVLTASQLAQLTVLHKVLSNLTLMEPVAKALSNRDVIYMEGFLDELSRSPLDLLLDHKAASLALETILTKINHSFPDLCSPSLKDLFQIKLVRLLPFVNTKIMMLFPTQIGCVDFHDISSSIVLLNIMKTRKRSRSLTDLVPQPSLKQSKIEDFVLTRPLGLKTPAPFYLAAAGRCDPPTVEGVAPRVENKGSSKTTAPNQSLNEPTLTELLAQQCFLVAETTASIQFQLDKIISILNYLVSWATSAYPGLTARQPDAVAGSSLPSLSKSTGQCNPTNSSNSTPSDANSHLVLQSKQVALNINPINGNLPHWGSIQLARGHILQLLGLKADDLKKVELLPSPVYCTSATHYKGLNSVYYKLDPMTQLAVFQSRLNFLEGQLAKEGVACTFTASNSRDWLHKNFGHSSYLANYSNFVHLDPSFNGFEVLDLLTSTQIGTLVVLSGILTDSSRMNAEMEADNVMNIFQSRNVSELQTFLLKISALAEQNNLVEITNVRVRGIMLKGIFQILKPQFVFMRITELELWFSRILTLYLPSITAQELKILPSPSNCTHLHVIVKGLDYVFALMLMETKIEVAQWIKTTLQTIDCHTTEDWLSLTFQRFRSIVNLTDLMAIDSNFSGIVHLKELSVAQLAQLTMTEEVLSSIDKVMKVFQRLGHFPSLDALAAYWDEFNIAFEKPTFVSILNISMEVKTFLLTKTIERLHKEFPTFTDLDYQLWFEKRLVMVLPSVTAAILQQIPISISCKAYGSVIAGIDSSFSEISQKRKTDILNYIVSFLTQKSQTTGPICSEQTTTRNWLLTFFRRFAMTVPYIQLVSYYRQSFD